MGRERRENLASEEGKYAYCIISNNDKPVSFGNNGITNSNEVYTVPYKDISAVVSDSPLIEYQSTEENMKSHNEVINAVMKKHSVIPMAFGMVFKDKEVLLSVLEKSYDAVKKTLTLLDNKVELGIKIVLNKELMELLDEDKKNKFASYVYESLKEKAVESVNGNLFSDRLLLNASFLVEKNKIEEFSKEIDKMEKMLTPKIQYTGPWPPYNFVKINIGKGV